jgi:hypothetical protein
MSNYAKANLIERIMIDGRNKFPVKRDYQSRF